MKRAISARIDEDTLRYFKSNGIKVNTLINTLLKGWMIKNQEKQLLIFQEETGQDELSQLKAKENFKCSQCCNNCDNLGRNSGYNTQCYKTQFLIPNPEIKKFCCIYWEKKKGSR